jgi:ferric-dicitrate binding protein FerR (iron transport regulator)
MFEKYKQYNAAGFLLDDDFIRSELHPTEETDIYWKEVAAQHPELQPEMQTAREVLAWMNRNRQPEILTEADEETLWRRIEQANGKQQTTKKLSVVLSIVGIAAAIALLIGLNHKAPEPETDYTVMIEDARKANTSTRDIQLILSDENHLSLDGKESEISYSEQGDILVNSVKLEIVETEKQQLNTLIVLVGKRSLLQLSDGTKMWVNSDSKVIYPQVFSSNKREIYVEGEIYLDVARNEKFPFVVKTKDTETTVLGTKFNVMAYPEDRFTDIVLVEGTVEVASDKRKNILEPNRLLRYRSAGEEITIKKVDVADHIAWIDGYYQFTSLTLNDLFGKISRYYGIRIDLDPRLNSLTCSGKLDLKDEPDKVLESLEKAASIKIKKTDDLYQIQQK